MIVLLHPLLGDRTSLDLSRGAVMEEFGDAVRTIVPESRGHGASAGLANRRVSLTDLAADLLLVLDAEAVTTAHLIGHELGAAVAFELARRRPERVASLTLIDPPLWGVLLGDADLDARADAIAAGDAAHRAADLAYKELTDRALDAWLDPRRGSGWRDRLTRPQLGAIRRHGGALAATLTALESYSIVPADAQAIATPTMLVSTAGAPSLDRIIAERLSTYLPNARLAAMPPNQEGFTTSSGDLPRAVTLAVIQFLADILKIGR